jgi:L-amino acid N-acyltransferase YncA
MDKFLIRMAEETDAEDILDIYSPYIKETAITFEEEIPHIDDFRSRIKDISSEYPYIVCLAVGRPVGYAYAHRQKERAAYQWNAELSVYTDGDYCGMGIGRALYTALLRILEIQNVRNVYAGIAAPNSRSENLHRSFGFELSGIFHSTGYKRGCWHDVMWFEKHLGDQNRPPFPFIKIDGIDSLFLADVFAEAAEQLCIRNGGDA